MLCCAAKTCAVSLQTLNCHVLSGNPNALHVFLTLAVVNETSNKSIVGGQLCCPRMFSPDATVKYAATAPEAVSCYPTRPQAPSLAAAAL